MDRFDAMQAFARVVEAGSFTKAAETLHMSKTTVTQLVQQLEARLRVKLLNRTTRKVNVTADGAVYYERVLRLLADMDDAETSLSGASTLPRGRLRVDVPSPLASMILVPALPEFYLRYPDIQIDMGVSDRIVDMIGENIDCVVRGGEIKDQSLMARKVGDLQLGVFAAPSYLARVGIPAHPRELEDSQHRIVGFLWARTGKALPYSMRNHAESLQVKGACAGSRRWQRLPRGRPGRAGCALAAQVHVHDLRSTRRIGAPVQGLASRSDADLRGISAEPAYQHQSARVHRLGRGDNGAACACQRAT